MNYTSVKPGLYSFCTEYVEDRIRKTEEAIRAAQEGANSESKSTAGDKHDVGRSMMQIEVERLSKQLAEASAQKAELSKINIGNSRDTIGPGSIAITNRGNYFVAIAAGKIEINTIIYFAVSSSSPIAIALKGLKKGSSSNFNGQPLTIFETA